MGRKKITKFLCLVLLLFFRPALRKKTASKRLAEMLLSEYSSGMEAGGAKVRKQSKEAGPAADPAADPAGDPAGNPAGDPAAGPAAGPAARPRPKPGLGRGKKQKK